MADVMMMVGGFKFMLTTAAYQQLRRTTEYRWPAQDRFGQLAALQATGPGADQITLPGVVFPEFNGGLGQLDALRALAAAQEPQLVVDGRGTIMGRWVIESVDEDQEIFAGRGAPLKQGFTVKMRKFSDDAGGAVSGLTSAVSAVTGVAAGADAAGLAQSAAGSMGKLSTSLAGSLASVQALVGTVSNAVLPAITAVRQGMTTAAILKSAAVDAQKTIASLKNINSLSSAEAALGGLTRSAGQAVYGANQASAMIIGAEQQMTANGDSAGAIATVRSALVGVNKVATGATSIRASADAIIRGFGG